MGKIIDRMREREHDSQFRAFMLSTKKDDEPRPTALWLGLGAVILVVGYFGLLIFWN